MTKSNCERDAMNFAIKSIYILIFELLTLNPIAHIQQSLGINFKVDNIQNSI